MSDEVDDRRTLVVRVYLPLDADAVARLLLKLDEVLPGAVVRGGAIDDAADPVLDVYADTYRDNRGMLHPL